MLTFKSLAVAAAGLASLAAARDCKAFPGTSDWPSAQTWAALNDAVGGRLLTPEPPAAPCHLGWNSSDIASCPSLAHEWLYWEFHYEHPTSVMWNQWTDYSCMPNTTMPCTGDSYPPFVINATTAEHVKIGIDFARENNVRLIIKNTGHDYVGKSIAPGALSIWTHHITGLTHHADSYTLDGSGKVINGSAISLGAGTLLYQAVEFASEHDEVVVGGGGFTVGYAGYSLGGGHGPLGLSYGVGLDNILEMEVVTPAGEILRVNEDQNSDLFWALRGGGGSTFGAVTEFVIQSHPAPILHSIIWEASVAEDFDDLPRLIAFLQIQAHDWVDGGLGGWNMWNTGRPGRVTVPGVREGIFGGTGSLLLAGPADGQATVDSVFQPTIDLINERWPDQVTWTHTVTRWDSLIDWFVVNYDTSLAGQSAFLGNRLMTGDLWTNEDDLIAAMEPLVENVGVGYVSLVGGPTVAASADVHGGSSLNPAWREFNIIIFAGSPVGDFTEAADAEAISKLNDVLEPIRQITPGSGSTLNEGFPYEADWKYVFWGDNYERLEEMKRDVDPEDVFWCFPCIAHDRWEVLPTGQLCKKE